MLKLILFLTLTTTALFAQENVNKGVFVEYSRLQLFTDGVILANYTYMVGNDTITDGYQEIITPCERFYAGDSVFVMRGINLTNTKKIKGCDHDREYASLLRLMEQIKAAKEAKK